MAGAGVAHSERDSERVDAMPAMVEEFPITDLVGKSAAHAGTGDDRSVVAKFLGPFDNRHWSRLRGQRRQKMGQSDP